MHEYNIKMNNREREKKDYINCSLRLFVADLMISHLFFLLLHSRKNLKEMRENYATIYSSFVLFSPINNNDNKNNYYKLIWVNTNKTITKKRFINNRF